MILQTDLRLRPPIRKWGCYYMCLAFIANKYTNYPLSVEVLSDDIYVFLQRRGWMDDNCFVRNPGKILREFFHVPVEFLGHKAGSRRCRDNEIEVLRWQLGKVGHFTVGNGDGVCTYDPWGVSLCATKGRVESKRVFRLLDGRLEH